MSFEAEVGYDLHEEIALDSSEEQTSHEEPLASFEENLIGGSESQNFDDVRNVVCIKRNLSICTLCGKSVSTHLQRHTLLKHLPWYFSPTSACWYCKEFARKKLTWHVENSSRSHWKNTYIFSNSHFYMLLWCQLMYGILVFFADQLNLSSVVQLLQIVLEFKLYPELHGDVEGFNAHQISRLKVVCQTFELPIPEFFAVSPPNHVVCILHWKIVVKLLDWIRVQKGYDVCQFKSFFHPFSSPVCSYSLGHISSLVCSNSLGQVRFADTHCHLDKIIQTIGVDNMSTLETNLSSLQFCVSNFVFPSRWNLIHYFLDKPMVHCTVGVHPHVVIPGEEQRQVSEVAGYLRDSRFIGVGEVGLDFQSCLCRCKPRCRNESICFERKKQAQLLFLRGVLPLADRHNLTLVLHCRDDGDGAAAREVLHLLKETGLTHLRIHRHCFIGTREEMQDWLQALPNVMFGITSKSLTDPHTLASLSELKLEKIVLETDSPYLKKFEWGEDPPGLKTLDFSPCEVYLVAHILSHVKQVPIPLLHGVCNSNAQKLYGLTN